MPRPTRLLPALAAGLCLLLGPAAAGDPATHAEARVQSDEFFALTARTAGGKTHRMEDFEGSVVLLVTAPRTCDDGVFVKVLEHLHSLHPYSLEILAFPFTSAAVDTSACHDALLARESQGSRSIRLMEHAAINGPDAHPLFVHLKALFGVGEMPEDFPGYFFVDPTGVPIEVQHGVGLDELRKIVNKHERKEGEL